MRIVNPEFLVVTPEWSRQIIHPGEYTLGEVKALLRHTENVCDSFVADGIVAAYSILPPVRFTSGEPATGEK